MMTIYKKGVLWIKQLFHFKHDWLVVDRSFCSMSSNKAKKNVSCWMYTVKVCSVCYDAREDREEILLSDKEKYLNYKEYNFDELSVLFDSSRWR